MRLSIAFLSFALSTQLGQACLMFDPSNSYYWKSAPAKFISENPEVNFFRAKILKIENIPLSIFKDQHPKYDRSMFMQGYRNVVNFYVLEDYSKGRILPTKLQVYSSVGDQKTSCGQFLKVGKTSIFSIFKKDGENNLLLRKAEFRKKQWVK